MFGIIIEPKPLDTFVDSNFFLFSFVPLNPELPQRRNKFLLVHSPFLIIVGCLSLSE